MRIAEQFLSRFMEQATLQASRTVGEPDYAPAPGSDVASPRVDCAQSVAPVAELQRRTAAYQATVEVLSKSLQPSLVDFLR
jgi:hypothetical protein